MQKKSPNLKRLMDMCSEEIYTEKRKGYSQVIEKEAVRQNLIDFFFLSCLSLLIFSLCILTCQS